MWRSVKILNIFSTLTLKQIFQKTKTFFKKMEYRILAERTKIEKASFPYKTAISEANVKTNKMVTTKWVYHWERSFASNYFSFLKVKEPLINNRFDVPTAQTPIFVLFLSAGVFFDGAFSLWVSLKKGEVGRVFVKTTFDKQSRIQKVSRASMMESFCKNS